MVVHHMGKMVGRNTGSLKQNRILIVDRHIQRAANRILHLETLDLIFRQAHIAIGFEPDDIRRAGSQLGFDFFHGEIAALCPLAVDAGIRLLGLLLRVDLRDVRFRHEARVGLSFHNQLLGETLVDRAAMALCVIAVVADVAVHRRALVKLNAEEAQRVDDDLDRAFYIAFVIGVLDSEKKFPAGLMRQPFVYERAVEITEVNETGRARSEPGDLRAGRQIAGRVHRLVIRGCLVDMRKQQLREFFIVHIVSSVGIDFCLASALPAALRHADLVYSLRLTSAQRPRGLCKLKGKTIISQICGMRILEFARVLPF